MKLIWSCLPWFPPGVLSWTKRHTNPRLRLWIREHLGGSYKSIPDQIKAVPDGRRFHIGPDLMYWAIHKGVDYEPEATGVVRTLLRNDDIAVDIGANFGWYTTLFAKLVPAGAVHAFEPVPSTFARLRETLALNHVNGNTTVVQAAVSDAKGMCTMYAPIGSSGLSSVVTDGVLSDETVEVPKLTLDDYVAEQRLPRVDFLKCDAEGSELFVLRGAHHLLNSDRAPILLLELNAEAFGTFGYTKQDVWRYLGEHGYDHYYEIVTRKRLRRLSTVEAFDAVAGVLCGKGTRIEDRLADHGVSIL